MLGASCYSRDEIDFKSISQIIAFQDDSLEISFQDLSVVQLSPCGANFKYTRPPKVGVDPALAKNLREIAQRCVFATSETRKKVTQAILIRNQLCSNPYLPEKFLVHQTKREIVQLYKDIEVFDWPRQDNKRIPSTCVDDSKTDCVVSSHGDGRVTVTCKKNYATLTLLPDTHRVHVRYVARASEKKVKGSQDMSGDSKTKMRTFMWQDRIFPVSDCPGEWKLALDLAMGMPPGNTDEQSTLSHVPATTPESCPRQFTHTWRSTMAYCGDTTRNYSSDMVLPFTDDPSFNTPGQLNIKLLWNNDTTFWVTGTTKVGMEVWLPDGSILKNHPTSERYFTHVIPTYTDLSKEKPVKFENRTISVTAIPHQDSKLKSVVLQSIRLLSYCREVMTPVADNRCWKDDFENEKFVEESNSDASVPGQLDIDTVHEKVVVPGLGTFSAINDSVQILFKDDSMLHMTLDVPSLRRGTSFDFSNLSKDQCRVIMSNGKYYSVTDMVRPPVDITSYVKSALDWVNWVIKPVGQRRETPFYSDTIHDPSKRDLVSHELDRIRRFNYLNSKQAEKKGLSPALPYMELVNGSSNAEACSQLCISNALKSTSKAIDDLDSVIKTLRGSKSV